MARIAGVNLPDNKHIVIALTGVYGIGLDTSKKICNQIKLYELLPKVTELNNN